MCSRLSIFLFVLLSVDQLVSESPQSPITAKQDDYDYQCIGDCAPSISSEPSPDIIVLDGSTNVDDAFDALDAYSDGGDVLVLPQSPTDMNQYAVSSLTLHKSSGGIKGDADFVVNQIEKADALFISGDTLKALSPEISDAIQERAEVATDGVRQQKDNEVTFTFHGINVQKLGDDHQDSGGRRRQLEYTVSAVRGELSLDPFSRFKAHLSPKELRRERVHRMVLWVMSLSSLVIAVSAATYFRNQLLRRRIKETKGGRRAVLKEEYQSDGRRDEYVPIL